jgi:hypothetical protein
VTSTLLYLWIGFKLWMVVDAVQRGVAFRWFCIIVCIPFGAVAYFVMVKYPGNRVGTRYVPSGADYSTEELRYQYEQAPSLDSEVRLAARLYDEGIYEEAETLYRQCLARDAQFARALYGFGLTQLELERFSEAADAFRKLLDVDRSYADYGAWRCMAEATEKSGDTEKAIEALRGLVTASPRLEHVVDLANTLIGSGRTGEARFVLEAGLLDHEHSPKHIQKMSREAARHASKILGRIS